MSAIITELREFAERLGKDGYPPALIERAADRMEAMEFLIVTMREELEEYEQTP